MLPEVRWRLLACAAVSILSTRPAVVMDYRELGRSSIGIVDRLQDAVR